MDQEISDKNSDPFSNANAPSELVRSAVAFVVSQALVAYSALLPLPADNERRVTARFELQNWLNAARDGGFTQGGILEKMLADHEMLLHPDGIAMIIQACEKAGSLGVTALMRKHQKNQLV